MIKIEIPTTFQTRVGRLLMAESIESSNGSVKGNGNKHFAIIESLKSHWKSCRAKSNIGPMGRSCSASRFTVFLAAVTISVLAVIGYQPAWHGGFIWDDDRYVT